jgi:hypothetical protein
MPVNGATLRNVSPADSPTVYSIFYHNFCILHPWHIHLPISACYLPDDIKYYHLELVARENWII